MSGRGQGRGRGRGGRGARGGSRGRGRGRSASRGGGRGGRGGGRGAGRGAAVAPTNSAVADEWGVEQTLEDETLDIQKDLTKFFVGTATFEQHFEAQEKNKCRYAAGMAVLEKNGVEVSQNARVRALAAAWARKDPALADSFLASRERFSLVEVLKACTLLDSSRRVRVEEKKLKRLQMQTAGKIKPRVFGKFKSNIDNLNATKPKIGSASGSVCKHVRRWVKKFTRDELEFYALHFPTEPWKRLADICHFNPKEDFPNLPWFLPFCFGQPAPDGTMVRQCRDVSAENVNDLLKEFPIPYSHVKSFKDNLTDESKARIASSDKLDQILWYYEELECKEVDEIVEARLQKGEEVNLPNGKLLERLLTIKMIREDIPTRSSYYGATTQTRNANPTKAAFIKHLIPLAETRLKNISLPLESPVVVIGDRSGSMEVAIRTSTIIASLMTAICSAKLVFFDNENMEAPFIPTNIEEVLEMAVTIQTGGCTAPAASLWPFYEKKEVVKTFLVVTDEEENSSCNNYRFAPLFKKYCEEVYPARLVFVSFLRTQHVEGQMIKALNNAGVTQNIMQFKFDQSRPDLTKLDKLFGLLSAEKTDSFEEEVQRMEVEITAHGMKEVFQRLTLQDENTAQKQEKDGKDKATSATDVNKGSVEPQGTSKASQKEPEDEFVQVNLPSADKDEKTKQTVSSGSANASTDKGAKDTSVRSVTPPQSDSQANSAGSANNNMEESWVVTSPDDWTSGNN